MNILKLSHGVYTLYMDTGALERFHTAQDAQDLIEAHLPGQPVIWQMRNLQ